jgi:hypothetical protein
MIDADPKGQQECYYPKHRAILPVQIERLVTLSNRSVMRRLEARKIHLENVAPARESEIWASNVAQIKLVDGHRS